MADQEKPKKKQRFYITVEGTAPVKVEFDTWAYDEEEALKQLDNPRMLSIRQRPDIDISRLQRRRITVKNAITSLVKIVKSF